MVKVLPNYFSEIFRKSFTLKNLKNFGEIERFQEENFNEYLLGED